MLCWWFGMQALILFSGADYVQMVVEMGMTEEYGWGLVNWTQSPIFYVCGIVTFICGLLGSLLGFRVFKKHFILEASGVNGQVRHSSQRSSARPLPAKLNGTSENKGTRRCIAPCPLVAML